MKNLSSQDIDDLEAFRRGELSDEDRDRIITRMKQDPGFQKSIQQWDSVFGKGFKLTDEEKRLSGTLKRKFQDWDQELQSATINEDKSFRKLYGRLSIAASLLILLSAGIWWFSASQHPADQYFEHLTRFEADLSNEKDIAQATYDNRDYDAAIPLLQEAFESTEDSVLLLYIGVAALGDNNIKSAISSLEKIHEAPNLFLYQETIKWYLALSYWQDGQEGKAKVILGEIVRDDSEYTDLAKDALRRLNQ